MSTEENIAIIRRGYEGFSAGNVESVLDQFDDDMEWVQPGDSALSGTYHGKGEFMDFLGKLGEKGATVTVDQIIADGDTVVAFTTVTMGGETARDADAFMLRDGKVVRAEVYTDTAMMERVYGKKQIASA